VAQHLSDRLLQADAALHSYSTAYWWSAGFFAVGTVVTGVIFRRRGAGVPALEAARTVSVPPAATERNRTRAASTLGMTA
jgi:hypothetical protein